MDPSIVPLSLSLRYYCYLCTSNSRAVHDRYVFSVAVIGCVYTLLQLPFAALNTIRGKKFIGRNTFTLYIFIDLVLACFH